MTEEGEETEAVKGARLVREMALLTVEAEWRALAVGGIRIVEEERNLLALVRIFCTQP